MPGAESGKHSPADLCRWTTPSWCAALALVTLCGLQSAGAIDDLSIEEDIADLLAERYEPERTDTKETRRWAILPEIGYGPDSGPVVGAKFTHRNLLQTGTTLNLEGVYAAFNNKMRFSVSIGQPHLADDRFLTDVRAKFSADPQRYFFGLGNNNQGPDPASTNSFQNIAGALTVGWRPVRTLAVNFTVAWRKVNIGQGDELNHCDDLFPCPSTIEAFPDLPGVHGGMVNPLSLSVVWNSRTSVVRPTHGWRAILKAAYTNKALLSDFAYTRIVGDVGYVFSFGEGDYILGIRGDGEYVFGQTSDIPYWELAELGGEDTMRGFFPHRFLGKGRALVNGEFRFFIIAFNFFKLWRIRLDGVAFGDGGRVFFNSSVDENDFRYSYGGGLRIALGEALVARIDAGFSEEETGLLYLSFGQTF